MMAVMAKPGRSAGPWILIGLGAVLGVVAVVGLVADLGAETTTSEPTAGEEADATTTTPAPSTTNAPTTEATTTSSSAATSTPTTVAPESAEAFLEQLAAAFRAGDVEFKMARLHPAVIERFGEDTCQTYLSSLPADPTAAFVVHSVSEPADYAWTTQDQTTNVPDTLTVAVTRTANGTAQEATIHLTAVDGELRWYTDCLAATS
jgi:hypothetical protein